MQFHIIDALGAFAAEDTHQTTINWSKVVFSDLEVDGRLPIRTQDRIATNFEAYVIQVARLGYDSVSIDDLAHLVTFPFYSEPLRLLLDDYRKLYERLFSIADKHSMRVFVNTDYLFFNDDIRAHLRDGARSHDDFYITVLERALSMYPGIAGVILRVGENDGKDVSGSFLSKLLLHTPAQANQLLKKILLLFEKHNKLLIFRTWTVGAYKIGDLIWNEKTFDKVFDSISSDALIISMKYGDTDFMRYLTLNPLFFRGKHKMLIELQTRREWEGMGNYPSFVGWDYAAYIDELAENPNIIGVHVWCQTGGWAKREWSNVTYLQDSSFWNELNTEVTIDLVRGMTVDAAIVRFCERRGIGDVTTFTELLRLTETAIKKGLYIADLASRELYFRRTRIPPLMWVTWDRVHLPPLVVYLHRMLLPKQNNVLADGAEAVHAIERAVTLARQLGLSDLVVNSLYFQRDTLTIFSLLRRYIVRSPSDKVLASMNFQIDEYQKKYPQHYDISPLVSIKRRRIPRSLLTPFVRESLPYRKRDRVFLKTSPIQARLIRYYLKKSKSHLNDQSMGLETLFK